MTDREHAALVEALTWAFKQAHKAPSPGQFGPSVADAILALLDSRLAGLRAEVEAKPHCKREHSEILETLARLERRAHDPVDVESVVRRVLAESPISAPRETSGETCGPPKVGTPAWHYQQQTTAGDCTECDGKGKQMQFHGPDDNYDAVDCEACDGTGKKAGTTSGTKGGEDDGEREQRGSEASGSGGRGREEAGPGVTSRCRWCAWTTRCWRCRESFSSARRSTRPRR